MFQSPGVLVGTLAAVKAVGDVIDPGTGALVAGARTAEGRRGPGSVAEIMAGTLPQALQPGMATTIGVVATDAVLTKPQARKLAQLRAVLAATGVSGPGLPTMPSASELD